ncbi:MAG TPA: hypothetical protein VG475_15040 [Pseudolabrys sp.]|jgi:hypothetical protein|nr:hypothetical protein [Pseudolabrys sp.]
MHLVRLIALAAVIAAAALPARAADDILDAIDQARKAYQSGDLGEAKQQLDTASQLIAQKNAEGFATLLPEPLAGWTADKAQSQAVGTAMFGGASSATRNYHNSKGDSVEITITGDSAMLTAMAPILNNPMLAGAMGKLVKVGDQRAIVAQNGDVTMVVNNKFVVTVHGSADGAAKLAYANAINIAKLSKM